MPSTSRSSSATDAPASVRASASAVLTWSAPAAPRPADGRPGRVLSRAMADRAEPAAGASAEPAPLDLTLPSGRLRAHVSGSPGGPTVIGIPGITSNSRAFDALARRLATDGRCVAALDLRG